ncbi:hypothetical protein ABPG72_013454 [Tetrahymena utriculariae]
MQQSDANEKQAEQAINFKLCRIQNSELNISKKNKVWFFLRYTDIFRYLPVPKTNEVSTLQSQSASVFAIFTLLGLFIFKFISLLLFNQPRITQHDQPIDNKAIYDAPDFAFGFFVGDSLQTFFNDDTYFEYYIAQYSQEQDQSGTYQSIEIKQQVDVCNPDWLNFELQLNCPSKTLKIQNKDIQNEQVLFPTVKLLSCNEQKQNILGKQCKNSQQVRSLFAQGRFLLFIQKQGQQNVKTNEYSEDSYVVYQFFITIKYQNLGETFLARKILLQNPDFALRFSQKKSEETYIQNFYQHLNKVNVQSIPTKRVLRQDNQANAFLRQPLNDTQDKQTVNKLALQQTMNGQKQYFQWSLNQVSNQKVINQTYKTVPDLFSFIGGIWDLIYGVFVLICVKRNANKFYAQKKSWGNFDLFMKEKVKQKRIEEINKINIQLEQIPSDFKNQFKETNENQMGIEFYDLKKILAQFQKKNPTQSNTNISNNKIQ